MGLISRVSSRTYRISNTMSDTDSEIPDNVNIINFDENEKADSGDENADYIENEFSRMQDFDDESDTEEPENPEESETNPPQIDQIAAGGIFSESSDINSTIASEFTGSNANFTQSHCGTSIIGDSIYTLKEKKIAEKKKSAARREERMNETDQERAEKRAKFGKTTAQVDYHQKTIENMRVWDETTVPLQESEKGKISTEERAVDDTEVKLEQDNDEFADYFAGKVTPRILITTSEGARNRSWKLALELGSCIPNSFVLPR